MIIIKKYFIMNNLGIDKLIYLNIFNDKEVS